MERADGLRRVHPRGHAATQLFAGGETVVLCQRPRRLLRGQQVFQERRRQLVFAGKVPVERADAQPGGLRDLFHASRAETSVAQHLRGGGKNLWFSSCADVWTGHCIIWD
jgi:hypothetical protein